MAAASNIYLVGLMGAGKTSVGKVLAKRLHKSFLDADHVLVERTGVKIPIIFEVEGEAGFRAREAAVINELSARQDIVLATVGGAVLAPANRAALRGTGTVVYLRAAPEELWRRTKHDKNRPLLQNGDPLATLQRLYQERDPLYRESAHLIVDTGNQSIARLATVLERELDQFERQQSVPAN
jgi:shikimate kinase